MIDPVDKTLKVTYVRMPPKAIIIGWVSKVHGYGEFTIMKEGGRTVMHPDKDEQFVEDLFICLHRFIREQEAEFKKRREYE